MQHSHPAAYTSPNNDDSLVQDTEMARAVLEEAGWRPGDDGIREKDGLRLSVFYQTSTNDARQGTQELIQEWWEAIGVETEPKHIDASVFFSSDDNPDSVFRFFADVQMLADVSTPGHFVTDQIPHADNKWDANNIPRWSNAEYDALSAESLVTPSGQGARSR